MESTDLSCQGSVDGMLEIHTLALGKKEKNDVFLCIKLQLKFSISFYYKCKQQTAVSLAVTCDFVTNGNHKYFRITKQLLQVPQKIVYLHRYLKIMVVIRFCC